MSRKLGYGGLANTNGARSFAGKKEEEDVKKKTKRRTYTRITPGY